MQIADWTNPTSPVYVSEEGEAPPLQRDPDKIADTLREYYKHLYKPAPQTEDTAAARKLLSDSLKGREESPPPHRHRVQQKNLL